MERLTSTSNQRIKAVAKLFSSAKDRRETGLFPVEGPRMVREIPKDSLHELFMTEEFFGTEEGRLLSEEFSGTGNCFIVTKDIMTKMSDTEHPQGVLATVSMEKPDNVGSVLKSMTGADDVTASGDGKALPLVFLEDIQDPGNLGTIIRSAEAAGTGGIIMSRGCADVFSPKVTRATMGSIFRVPMERTERDFREVIRDYQAAGYRFFAACLSAERHYFEAPLSGGKTAVLIGNEGNGLSDEVLALSDEKILIPMEGRSESLNAAVACAVILFEAARQRNTK